MKPPKGMPPYFEEHQFVFKPDPRRGYWRMLSLKIAGHAIQVMVSTSGRSVQVYVDDEKVFQG